MDKNYDVERATKLLNSVGKQTFIDYYYSFKNGGEINFLMPYKASSIQTKIYAGRKIFTENLHIVALEIIKNSKINDDKAANLLKEELSENVVLNVKFNNNKKSSFTELKEEDLIKLYGDLVQEFKERDIIRTKKITGDLGERYAVNFYNKHKNVKLKLEDNSNKDFDALANGIKYQIKTVTQKQTGQISRVTSRENKLFDFLIIVILDDNYKMLDILELTWDEFFGVKKSKSEGKFFVSINSEIRNRYSIFKSAQ